MLLVNPKLWARNRNAEQQKPSGPSTDYIHNKRLNLPLVRREWKNGSNSRYNSCNSYSSYNSYSS